MCSFDGLSTWLCSKSSRQWQQNIKHHLGLWWGSRFKQGAKHQSSTAQELTRPVTCKYNCMSAQTYRCTKLKNIYNMPDMNTQYHVKHILVLVKVTWHHKLLHIYHTKLTFLHFTNMQQHANLVSCQCNYETRKSILELSCQERYIWFETLKGVV